MSSTNARRPKSQNGTQPKLSRREATYRLADLLAARLAGLPVEEREKRLQAMEQAVSKVSGSGATRPASRKTPASRP